jgi:hypothetical protein
MYPAEDRPDETSAAGTEASWRGGNTRNGSFNMRRKISSTTYEVEVYFNPASRETMDEKILRLVRRDAMNNG